MLNWVSYMDDQDLSEIQYQMNDASKAVKILDTLADIDRAASPVTHFFEEKYYGRTVTNVDF